MSTTNHAALLECLRVKAQEAREQLVTVEQGFGVAYVDAEDLDAICDAYVAVERDYARLRAALEVVRDHPRGISRAWAENILDGAYAK